MEAVRTATADDVAILADLAAAALDEQREARGGELLARRDSRPRPADAWLADAIADRHHRVLVGGIQVDDELVPVGYAVAHTEELRDGGRLAVVDELFVEPAARGVAVGEALMDDLLDWARREGCFGIDAVALPGNRATKNFFERFGLTARALVVHKRLDGQ